MEVVVDLVEVGVLEAAVAGDDVLEVEGDFVHVAEGVSARGFRDDDGWWGQRAVGVVGETFACQLRADHRRDEPRKVAQVCFSYRGSEHAEQGAGVDEQKALASLDPQEVQVPVPVVCGRVSEGCVWWELVEDLPGAADDHGSEGSRGGR